MADKARRLIDKRISEISNQLFNIYTTAESEISESWNAYMRRVQPQLDSLYKDYSEALLSGDKTLIEQTKEAYQEKLRWVTVRSDYYKDMLNVTSENLSRVNQTAIAYVNGEMAGIYTLGYNALSTSIPKSLGYRFDLVDEMTVRILSTSNNSLLPYKRLSVAKDIAWNKKALNSQILQGILQGESIPKIAKRLQNVTDMNRKSAVRNARTMVNCAENKGRQASYEKAQDDGIVMHKVWLSTIDSRTRDSHLDLNGEEVEVNEEFSNGLDYPGDATGRPEEVYNCRCTMKSKIIGFVGDNGKINYVKG